MVKCWREQRRSGIGAIAASSLMAGALWLAVRFLAPPLDGMTDLSSRMLFALQCVCVAVLFCLVAGVEAVAHERLQSPAFDPLDAHRTRRLEVNRNYLQNTVEQTIIFAVGLFGLAAYSPDGASMRAVEASAIVWILSRFAFWIGYHHSAAMRGLGAPGMMVSLLTLIYVVGRISYDVAGAGGAAATIGAFLLLELVLFRATRATPASEERL